MGESTPLKSIVNTASIYTIQNPTPVVMGTSWEWVVQNGTRKLVEKKHLGYYVDLFSCLKVSS